VFVSESEREGINKPLIYCRL